MTPLPTRRASAAILAGCLLLLLTGAPALEALQVISARLAGETSTACAFRARYGFDCLGCGGTRAFAAAARGRFGTAFRLNRLGAMVGLTTWLTAFGALVSIARGRMRHVGFALMVSLVALSVTMVVHAVLWWRALPPGFH